MKKILSNIRNQLILGISLIVLTSTIFISIIFISQYRILTLKQAEVELNQIAIEFLEVGQLLISPDQQRPRRVYIEAMKNLSNAEVWILRLDNRVVLDTTETLDLQMTQEIIEKYNSIETSTITYEYTDYFDNKTMTIIKPIVQGDNIGLVVVHKDIKNLYSSYSDFILLVFFSLILSVLISLILSIFYSNFFTKPLYKIIETAKQIKAGNYKVKTEINRTDQIGELAKTIDVMSFEIDKNITEIKGLEELAKELVSSVSHEFKTPLTLIKGYTLNMRDKTIKPQKEIYNKILNNTEILEDLVNSLLEINLYQSGTIKLSKEKVNLNKLIDNLVSDMQTIAQTKGIDIKLNMKDSVIIEADLLKIRQLLTIFIDNSIKYSDDNKEIKINLTQTEIEIIDYGKGMKKSELEKIFNKYYKINKNERGYGLGLFIAKHIIELHNYKLVIISEKGKGTNIKINLNTDKS